MENCATIPMMGSLAKTAQKRKIRGWRQNVMIKKRLEWLKRGLCITLAGAMIICSDTMAFAADAANRAGRGTDRRDRSFDG